MICSFLGVPDYNNITLPLATGLTVGLFFLAAVATTLVIIAVIFKKLFYRPRI